MQKKTILIITTLFVVGIISVYYLYTKNPNSPSPVGQPAPITKSDPSEPSPRPNPGPESKRTDQKWQEEICKNLSRDECASNDNCFQRLVSAPCGGTVCPQVMIYDSCAPTGLNTNEIRQIEIECNKIGGEFGKSSGIMACNCGYPDCDISLRDLIKQLENN